MTSFRSVLSVMVLAVIIALNMSTLNAQAARGKEHAFRGKVENVDAKAGTLTVAGETVEGWMSAMTMTYAVDKKEVVAKIKAGDQITAKVYDGDQRTLYDVQVSPPKDKK